MLHDTYDDAVVMMLSCIRTSMACPSKSLDLALATSENYNLWKYTVKSDTIFNHS